MHKTADSWLRREKKFEHDVKAARASDETKMLLSARAFDALVSDAKRRATEWTAQVAAPRIQLYCSLWQLERLRNPAETATATEISREAAAKERLVTQRVAHKLSEIIDKSAASKKPRTVSNEARADALLQDSAAERKELLGLLQQLRAGRLPAPAVETRVEQLKDALERRFVTLRDMQAYGYYEKNYQLFQVLHAHSSAARFEATDAFEEIAFSGEQPTPYVPGAAWTDAPLASLPRSKAKLYMLWRWSNAVIASEQRKTQASIQERLAERALISDAPTPPLQFSDESDDDSDADEGSGSAADTPSTSESSEAEAKDDDSAKKDVLCEYCDEVASGDCDVCNVHLCSRHERECTAACKNTKCRMKGLWSCKQCEEHLQRIGNKCDVCDKPR